MQKERGAAYQRLSERRGGENKKGRRGRNKATLRDIKNKKEGRGGWE